jgi:hypothetical protein
MVASEAAASRPAVRATSRWPTGGHSRRIAVPTGAGRADITERLFFLAVQQIMRLRHVTDAGGRADRIFMPSATDCPSSSDASPCRAGRCRSGSNSASLMAGAWHGVSGRDGSRGAKGEAGSVDCALRYPKAATAAALAVVGEGLLLLADMPGVRKALLLQIINFWFCRSSIHDYRLITAMGQTPPRCFVHDQGRLNRRTSAGDHAMCRSSNQMPPRHCPAT